MKEEICICPGSRGPHLAALGLFLLGNGSATNGLDMSDLTYGENMTASIKALQEELQDESQGNKGYVVVNGQIDALTLKGLQEYYAVNLLAELRRIPGQSRFVQLDGSYFLFEGTSSL